VTSSAALIVPFLFRLLACFTICGLSETTRPSTKIGGRVFSVLVPLVLLQYAAGGALYPFLGPYLESAKGFDVRQLSLLALGAAVVNCVMPFVWGALSDRVIAVNRLICLLHLSAAFSLLLFSRGAGLIMLTGLFALYTAQQQPTNSLSNALCYHSLADPPRQFGSLRLWGSVGWALPSVPIAFWLLDGGERSLHFIIYLTFGLHLVLVLLYPWLPHTPPAGREEGSGTFRADLKGLFLAPGFARLLLVTFLAQAGFAIMFYLSPLALSRSLASSDIRLGWLGPIQTVGVILEIPLFLLLPRFLGRFGYRKVLAAGVAASLVRHMVFATSTEPWVLALASQLIAPCVVFFLIGVSLAINSIAGSEVRATSQTLLALTGSGLGSVLGLAASSGLSSGDSVKAAFFFASGCSLVSLLLLPGVRFPGAPAVTGGVET